MGIKNRGFSIMEKKKLIEVSRKGGLNSQNRHKFTPEIAKEMRKKQLEKIRDSKEELTNNSTENEDSV